MQVLCPVDFSEVSVNASKYAAAFLKGYTNAKLHLCHFIYFKRRAGMFINIDEIFKERAQKDFDQLISELTKKYPKIEISYSIYATNPKDGIVNLAKKKNYDLVVVGSTGLTALKNITIGSVTEHLMDKSRVPVLAIPGNTKFKAIKRIALAVDDEIIENLSTLSTLKDLCIHTKAALYLIHVAEKGDSPYEYDPGIDMYLRGLKYTYEKLSLGTSLNKTLNKFCEDKKINMLCMVRHKKNWVRKILSKSITKTGLFHLELPLLTLNQK